MGLTFCKMAVEAHGGKIGARNDADEGCSFWFTIPHSLKSGEAEACENAPQNHNKPGPFSETDLEQIKEVVKKIKGIKIFEISRFQEILDPLKATSGIAVNEWISHLFSAIFVQNVNEYNRLINLPENEQTKNTDR